MEVRLGGGTPKVADKERRAAARRRLRHRTAAGTLVSTILRTMRSGRLPALLLVVVAAAQAVLSHSGARVPGFLFLPTVARQGQAPAR